jgi:hypothetical protein
MRHSVAPCSVDSVLPAKYPCLSVKGGHGELKVAFWKVEAQINTQQGLLQAAPRAMESDETVTQVTWMFNEVKNRKEENQKRK